MTTNVGPAAKAMVDRTGVKLDALMLAGVRLRLLLGHRQSFQS